MTDPQTIEAAVLAVLRDIGRTCRTPSLWVRLYRRPGIAYDIEGSDMDKALQRLRRRGLIRYLRTKAEGGPGWVLCEGVPDD